MKSYSGNAIGGDHFHVLAVAVGQVLAHGSPGINAGRYGWATELRRKGARILSNSSGSAGLTR